MKLVRYTSLIILSLIIAVACNSKKHKKDTLVPAGSEEKIITESIGEGDFYEECIELYPNQVLHYSFNATQNLDFNIHYHGMEGRKYAIKKNQVSSFSGELVCDEMDFYSTEQENFCMIWSNLNENQARLRLSYYITTRPAP